MWHLHWIAETTSDPLNGVPPWAYLAAGLSIPSIGCSVLWKALVKERREKDELAARAIPLLSQAVDLIEENRRQTAEKQRDDLSQMLAKVERLAERFDDRR